MSPSLLAFHGMLPYGFRYTPQNILILVLCVVGWFAVKFFTRQK